MAKIPEAKLAHLHKPVRSQFLGSDRLQSAQNPYIDEAEALESFLKARAKVTGPFNSAGLPGQAEKSGSHRVETRYQALFEHTDQLIPENSDPVIDFVGRSLERISAPCEVTVLEIPQASGYYDSLMYLLIHFAKATKGNEILIHLAGADLPVKKGKAAEKIDQAGLMDFYFRRFFWHYEGIYPPPSLYAELSEGKLVYMNNRIFEKNRKRAREIRDYLGQEGLQNQENPRPLINKFSPRIIFTRGELYKLVPELEKKYKRKIPLIIADRPSDARTAELQFVARNGEKSVLIIRPADISQPRFVSPAKLKAAEKKIIKMCNEDKPLDNGLPTLYGLINAQESQSRDIVPDTTD